MTTRAAIVDLTISHAPLAAADTCRHCGDTCGREARVTAEGTFCCAGCEAVFGLIAAHGLTAFYACDVPPGVSQRKSGSPASPGSDVERFAAFDEPAAARRLLHEIGGPGGDRVAVTFHVPALHCASCLWLLEQLWRFDAGVLRSEADLTRRSVRVEFDRARTTLRRVAEALAAIGYAPVVDPERMAGTVSQARRDMYLRIGVAGFAFGNVMLFSIPRYANGAPLEPEFQRLFDVLNILFSLPVLFYSASPYFRGAVAAMRARTITLEVPVALGLIVLYARSIVDISTGWGEGFLDSFSGLVFFLLIGRLFQQKAFDSIAFDRTVRSFFPLSVRVERQGSLHRTPLEEIRVGDVMALRPGEVIPADAVLADPEGVVDYAFVTGEADPVAVAGGAELHAGGRVVGHSLRLMAMREVSHSRLAELWSHPVFAKPKQDTLTKITSAFGFWFVVVAIGLAAGGAIAWWPDARAAAQVATAVLIIACPCALTLAAPITLGTGMGLLGRAGCYVKSTAVALELGRVDTVVFDKTGTLTTAVADASVTFVGLAEDDVRLVRRLAAESVHPVSRAIAGRDLSRGVVRDVVETPGAGIAGVVDAHRVAIGSARFVECETGSHGFAASGPSRTWVSVDNRIGRLKLSSESRDGMDAALSATAREIDELWLLSGDDEREAPRWEPWFGSRMFFRQAPEDKLAFVQALQADGRRVLMVGDGLNDAAALAAADVGIAVSDDSACLVPACDAVISGDRLRALPTFVRYARLARRVIVLCFTISILYNFFGLWLALAGRLTPLATAILMPVSSLTIVGVSVGLMRRGARRLTP
jgi:Cu+-exporting ATPase